VPRRPPPPSSDGTANHGADVPAGLGLAALEIAPQALVVTHADDRVWLMNARARCLLGLADTAAVASWPGRLPAAGGGAREGGWVTLPRGDGTGIPCWVWSRPLPPAADSGTAVLHALWPCRVDATPPAAGEHPGLGELVALTAHHALSGEMGGALAHQMSQPLNIIRLTAERAVLEAERAAGPNAAHDPLAERFARLADQAESLFDLMTLVQGAPPVTGTSDLIPVDLGAVVTRAANLARGPLRAAGLRADLITPTDMPRAWAEPITLLQVSFAALTALAESALGEVRAHHTRPLPSGQRTAGHADRSLVVRVDAQAAPPGRLVVDVARGLGAEGAAPLIPVPPDLSVSRRMVLAAVALAPLGGHLLMLVDDQGALRGARLDLARVAAPATGNAADGTASSADDDRRVRILLAEDEIEAATEMAEYLSDLDYLVTTVEDAPSGVQALDQAAFDVVISDVSMPGGGALSLLRAVEAGHPDIAVILVSGLALDTDETRAELADMADAVLRKPIGLAQLRETLERVLGG